MKQLNAESTNILDQLDRMMSGWCVRIDNFDGEFVPILVSTTYDDDRSKKFTVGHYYSEDGNILADPEMQFLCDENSGSFYPIYYRQDSLEIENYSVKIDDGLILGVNKLLQSEHVEFANHWLKNIKLQQNL